MTEYDLMQVRQYRRFGEDGVPEGFRNEATRWRFVNQEDDLAFGQMDVLPNEVGRCILVLFPRFSPGSGQGDRAHIHCGAVKIGLMSDIHCNLEGLQGALRELADCEELLCAGDLLYQYRFSTEVLALLEERGVHAIVGNHDRTILQTPSHPLRASVDPAALDYLATIPLTLSLKLDALRVAMFHGAPWDDPNSISATYIYPENQHDLRRVAQVDADVVVLGHTHRAFTTRINGTLIVNPGSCGESRDGTDLLSCAILDTSDQQVEFRKWPQ